MANKPKESKKIRDLIRIGIFTALWIAVGWIIACKETWTALSAYRSFAGAYSDHRNVSYFF